MIRLFKAAAGTILFLLLLGVIIFGLPIIGALFTVTCTVVAIGLMGMVVFIILFDSEDPKL